MEIVFEKRHETRYRESVRADKRIRESVESVVPDTEEDVGRIAAVQSSVLLKSKELSGRGVLITGEARACVLCISEGQGDVISLRVVKPFTAEFELEGLTGEELTQVTLTVAAADARILNPRKLSVSFELAAELSCFVIESIPAETAPPRESCQGLHVQCSQKELILPNAVCEKNFVLSDQFPLSAEKAERLLSEQTELRIEDCQLIGSKAVVKGRAVLRVAWQGAEGGDPVQSVFTAPFSQILDIGAETMELCTVQPQLTGAYYDLIDSISGERVIDAELHILLQLVSRSRMEIRTVTDAYSNLMPLTAETETLRFESAEERRTLRVTAAESIGVTEDCADVLCVFTALSRCVLEGETLRAAANFDILYRSESGELSAVRRTLPLEGDGGAGLRLVGASLTETELRPSGKSMESRVTLEAQVLSESSVEIDSIRAVTLDEAQAFARGSFPTLTMVRPEGESLWELAKRYHSSVEAIEAFSAGESAGGMLLIPKSV